MLSPETFAEIIKLAAELHDAFTPPELIVGCEVKSVADKDEYATDNGWIEAVCGRHNQQRCRWRGQFPTVEVGDFVDVLFFQSFRLFTVFGQGGSGTLKQGGWPFDDIKSVDSTDPKADYSSLASMISGISAGQTVWLNSETFSETIDISKSITVRGASRDDVIITKDDAFIVVTVSAAAYISTLRVENVRSASGTLNAYGVQVSANTTLNDLWVDSNPPNATGGNCYGIVISSVARIENSLVFASNSSMTQHAAHVSSGGFARIVGGFYSGTEASIYVESGATAILEGPVLAGPFINLGTASGWYIDSSTGNKVFLDKVVLKDIGLTHGVTTFAETDVYLQIEQATATNGGTKLWSFSDIATLNPFRIISVFGTDPMDTIPAIWLIGAKRSGTNVAALSDGETLLSVSNNGVGKVVVLGDGTTGIGTTTPQGKLHGYDSISGFIHWEYDGLDATARTIIPNGAGDVIYGISFLYVVRDSGGSIITGQSGTSTNVNLSTAGGTINVRINADGSLDARRTSGSVTFKVAFWILFM